MPGLSHRLQEELNAHIVFMPMEDSDRFATFAGRRSTVTCTDFADLAEEEDQTTNEKMRARLAFVRQQAAKEEA